MRAEVGTVPPQLQASSPGSFVLEGGGGGGDCNVQLAQTPGLVGPYVGNIERPTDRDRMDFVLGLLAELDLKIPHMNPLDRRDGPGQNRRTNNNPARLISFSPAPKHTPKSSMTTIQLQAQVLTTLQLASLHTHLLHRANTDADNLNISWHATRESSRSQHSGNRTTHSNSRFGPGKSKYSTSRT